MYHDLREDDDFDDWMRIPVSDFERQIIRLKELGEIVDPTDLVEPTAEKRLRFLITFDDGYVNNYKLAAPILQRHGVPAIFFVSTEHMQSQEPFWPDLVVTPIQVLALDRLDLSEFQFGVFKFRLGGSAGRWDDIDRLLRALKEKGNSDHPTVAAVLRHMQTEFADVLAMHLPRFRPLNRSELAEMSTEPLFHFGSHGHRHDILTYNDTMEITTNLQKSRRILEDVTGRPVTHLAYPNGDYNAEVASLVQAAGYRHAYTNIHGVVDERTPPLAIPRLGIGGVVPCVVPFYQLNRLLFGELIRGVWPADQDWKGRGGWQA